MSEPYQSSEAFFEAKYRENADPWNFAGNPEELRRYDAVVAALAHRRYAHGFEPGCSLGVLTERLAPLCDALDAIDISATAAARAQARCTSLPHVHIRQGRLPEAVPCAPCDLLVLSEIGYYFSQSDWRGISDALLERLPVGATVLAVHWLGYSMDHRMSGDEVHTILLAHPQLKLERAERHTTFRLERWERQ